MVTVFGFDDSRKSDRRGDAGASILNGVSFQVAREEMTATTRPIGFLDAPPNAACILDDLGFLEMRDEEKAVVREMLEELRSRIDSSVALARDLLTFNDYTPDVRTP